MSWLGFARALRRDAAATFFLQPRASAPCLGGVEYLAWSLTILLMLVGLAGTFLPLLPGTLLILIAALIHKLLLPDSFSWFVFGWLAAFWAVSVLADVGCTLVGARLFGGSKWGMAGAGGGAMVGMFVSLPALILGSILGAIAAEKLGARRTDREALRAGAGAAVGFLLSTVVRLGCGAGMIALFLVAVLGR
jgi:uncharacterized protein YqgC (DUF456 family)